MKPWRILFLSFFLMVNGPVGADLNLIRDAEIEETLTEMVKSVFKVAGLRPESAKVYVVNSDVLNAFTPGNGYIFINSGLLLRFDDPLHLLGILCHETGHLAAGHVHRHISVLEQRSKNLAVALTAGIVGAMATGPVGAMALLLGYFVTDERFYLHFSRGEELAADALAATYLEKLGYGSDALLGAFDVFQRMDILNGEENLSSYIRTHPKTSDRISALSRKGKIPKITKASDDLSKKYRRVLVKLKAHLKRLDLGASDDDYSRAVYFHRVGKSKEAIEVLRKLVSTNPHDFYYRETLAQTLYESGNLNESIKVYEEICHGNRGNILTKIDYANVLIEAGKKINKAIAILETAKYSDYLNGDIYRLLAKGYGKQGKEGLSLFMLAQEQMLMQNYQGAYDLLVKCLEKLNPKTENSHIKKAKYFKELLDRDHKEGLQFR